MHLFGFLGLVSLFTGFVISTYLSILWFQGHGIGHRPLLFLGILLIIVGVQSFSLGLIGDMLTSTKNQNIKTPVREEVD
jgi:hypothetical protein